MRTTTSKDTRPVFIAIGHRAAEERPAWWRTPQTRGGCLILLVVVLAVGGRARGDGEEGERPYAGLLPVPSAQRNVFPGGGHASGCDFVATRVVDARTGEPLDRGRLRHFEEDVSGLCTRYAPLLAEARANEDGFAWVALDDEQTFGHWIVDAPGYAPMHEYGLPQVRTELKPGVDMTARLADPLGQPLAGVEVEWWLGCPHAPALGSAQTGPDGVFTFRATNPEGFVWVHGPPRSGTGLGLDVSQLSRPGTRRSDLILESGVAIRGRVLDVAGQPVAGAVIRADDQTRGPVVATGADGSFVLKGVVAESDLRVYHPMLPDGEPEIIEGATENVPLAVRLSPEGLVWDDPEDGVLLVTLRVEDGAPIDNLDLRLTRADGRSWVEPASPMDGPTAFAVPAGSYRLSDADPFEPVAVGPTEVVVVANEETTLTAIGRRRHPVMVEGPGYRLSAGGHDLPLDDASATPRLSADEPASVLSDGHTVVAVGPPENGIRRARVPELAQHQVTIPGIEIDSWLVTLPSPWEDVGLDGGREPAGGRIRTRATGDVVLFVDSAHGEELRFRIDLPASEWVELVLDPARGRVVPVGGEAQVHFRCADGSPVEDATLTATGMPIRDGEEETTPYDVCARFAVLGAESPQSVKAPCHVVLEAPGLVTLETDIREPGEHRLEWGACGLRLSASDPAGSPAEAVVLVDGHLYRTTDARLDLAGLEAGPHRIVVTPTTRKWRGVVIRMVLGAREVREATVRFESR